MEGEEKRGAERLLAALLIVVLLVFLIEFAGAFRSARPMSPETRTITNNLRHIAYVSDRFLAEEGVSLVHRSDLVGQDRPLATLPVPVAGETYETVFPISLGFTQLEVSRADGEVVRYVK